MKHTTIAIIGTGNVGSATAYALMLKNIATEIILVDIDEQHCKGEVLDLVDALFVCQTSSVHVGTPSDASQADIIIITAGAPQTINQPRSELLSKNKNVIAAIAQSLQPVQPNALILMVTNPLDTLTLYAQELIDLPRKQIFGSGTFLDSQRLCATIADTLQIAPESIDAYMLGEHGDSQFAAWSCAHVDGIPIVDFPQITPLTLDAFEKEARQKVYEIIACKGSTYFGIASCITEICAAIVFNKKLIMPLSCYQEQFNICLTMPTILSENGIEKIINIPLNPTEKEKLLLSVKALQQLKNELFY